MEKQTQRHIAERMKRKTLFEGLRREHIGLLQFRKLYYLYYTNPYTILILLVTKSYKTESKAEGKDSL